MATKGLTAKEVGIGGEVGVGVAPLQWNGTFPSPR